MKRIKVLVVEPHKAPYVKELDDTIKAKPKIISPWIKRVSMPNYNLAFFSENKGANAPFNRTLYNSKGRPIGILTGKIYLCLSSPDNNEYYSLSDELIEKYQEVFSLENGNKVFAFN